MNEYDSNRIIDLVKSEGYVRTEDFRKSDCYVLNTCHIREKATEKVYHDIGRLKKNFKNKKKPFVFVTGCVAQAENNVMLKREPYIDGVIGPQSYHKFPEILSRLNKKDEKINATDFEVIDKFDKLNTIRNKDTKVSAFVTIQEGCDKFCNFCVVPYTRGPEHSRSPQDIYKEVQTLLLNGAKEITLLGQNVNAYNFKKGNKEYRLSDLINKIHDLENLKRIRYTTSHPKDMTKDLIDVYKDSEKLMPFLHLPIQSGSDRILKKMNRKHNIKEYLEIIENLKIIRPEMQFSSDFIVGYPGETEKDFEDTISIIKKVEFINSFSFIYSPRPGTPAAKSELLNKDLLKNRLIILQNLLEGIQKEKNKLQIGKSKKILIENKLKKQIKYFGRTEYMTPVVIDNVENSDIGKIINVKIDKYNRITLFGLKKNYESEAAA
tara:strand:+ start:1425 stop:2729 length:1305 start_codon:yes stop_codon:yes gene_type:complete